MAEVNPIEYLMREHGVIRRVLLIYDTVIKRLEGRDSGGFSFHEVGKAAKIFRTFGEDYHEKICEELLIFPIARKLGSKFETMIETLKLQHEVGREVTDYIMSSVNLGSRIDPKPFISALSSLVLMYRNHAAREDTVLFPAATKNLSESELEDIGGKMEETEASIFGKNGNGFDYVTREVSGIEGALGLLDLNQFTAKSPPPLESPYVNIDLSSLEGELATLRIVK